MLFPEYAASIESAIRQHGVERRFEYLGESYDSIGGLLRLQHKDFWVPVFNCSIQKSLLFKKITGVSLTPLVAVSDTTTTIQYLFSCKYHFYGDSLGHVRSQLEELKSKRISLMQEEAAIEAEMKEIIKEMDANGH